MSETKPFLDIKSSRRIVMPADDAPAAPGIRKKLMKLEALRGFAALYVLCHHTFPKYTVIAGHPIAFFRFPQEALMIFFILSGFVIQYAYINASDKSFTSFFLKRLLRIHIPLVCVFAANYIIFVVTNDPTISTFSWSSLIGNLLMLQQVNEMWMHPVLFHPFLENLPLWSLSFEWWFYMIFFFAFTMLGNKASRFVYATGIIAALIYLIYPFFLNRELMYLVIWWSGAEIAKLYAAKKDINIKNLLSPLLSLSTIFIILVCHALLYKNQNPAQELEFVRTPLVELRHFGFSVIAIVIAVYWRKLKWFGFKYTFGLFEPLASISFTLYISHWFLVSHATYLDAFISNIYLKSLAYFIPCCLFCYLVERIIYPPVSKRILSYFSVKKKPFVAVG